MDIYQPAEDSYLINQFVKQYAIGRVLDMGTGSGIQALTAIKSPNVREVIAVDINEQAIIKLNNQIKEKKLRKIKAINGNLFENVAGHFNLIVFNPPYLPQDKGIEDPALYGGKRGWEISERFFSEVSNHLSPDGKILFLFSTLTNKKKIDEIIGHNLLQSKRLASEKLSFEELYVYEITKLPLLRTLESKGLNGLHFFAQGKRGIIYRGILERSKLIKTHFSKREELVVAVKTTRKESQAINRINNEIRWLKILNKKNIGPRLLFYGEDYFVYQFVEGKFILDWLKKGSKDQIRQVLINILDQCATLDQLKVNKEEMHHPHKHIIIDKYLQPVMIDFERCSQTEKPHNVTQYLEFLGRLENELSILSLKKKELRELAREYKENYSSEILESIKKMLIS